ncbi:HutD/Ves family protein [Ottowia thiooxydans]|uniref:Environmental stress-induced protein Ves n=1 Tax=Ottowia thiooxydans TaxID=219182 RepID=A0ABV2QG71_9BURK
MPPEPIFQRFDVAQIPDMPWKNKGGQTREIATWPPGADMDGFDWRISIASIDADGPFSVFEDVDRIITLLDGDGVHLSGRGIDHDLTIALEPFEFSGDASIDCRLKGQSSRDFNVMTRRSRLKAELQVIRGATELPCTPYGLLLAQSGHWQAGDQSLLPGQGLWWASAPAQWSLKTSDPNAAMLAVQWRAAP